MRGSQLLKYTFQNLKKCQIYVHKINRIKATSNFLKSFREFDKNLNASAISKNPNVTFIEGDLTDRQV